MTPERFTEIGIKLFGPRWKSAMGRALGLHSSNVAKKASGEVAISEAERRAIEGPALLDEPAELPDNPG